MAQTSGTFPALNARQRSAKQTRFLHAKREANRKLPSMMGKAPAPRVPGGLAAHRAMARAKARGGKGC
jgi:hypothetical protein